MKLSTKIIQHSSKPLYKVSRVLNNQVLEIGLPVLKSKLIVSFSLAKEAELIFDKIDYQTDLSGDYLGVVDLYIAILQKRAVEACDRINAKEFDYYCRGDKSSPAFEYYNNEFYEILGVGEKIFKFIFPKEEKVTKLIDDHVNFFDLAYTVQMELIEEALAIDFYQIPLYQDIDLDIVDIADGIIFINKTSIINEPCLREIEKSLVKYLFADKSFELVLR
jgi:hypothetical protein